jgi:hypothetical protein
MLMNNGWNWVVTWNELFGMKQVHYVGQSNGVLTYQIHKTIKHIYVFIANSTQSRICHCRRTQFPRPTNLPNQQKILDPPCITPMVSLLNYITILSLCANIILYAAISLCIPCTQLRIVTYRNEVTTNLFEESIKWLVHISLVHSLFLFWSTHLCLIYR